MINGVAVSSVCFTHRAHLFNLTYWRDGDGGGGGARKKLMIHLEQNGIHVCSWLSQRGLYVLDIYCLRNLFRYMVL